MTPEELQEWLEAHIDEIFAFMDYEPTLNSEEEFVETMGYWFGRDDWNEPGYRFVHLGIDGMGSEFVAWIRPGVDGPAPVVYFGSEGGRGVLARSPKDWAMVLAHAPGIIEYAFGDDPAQLDVTSNWMLEDDDPEFAETARQKLASYRDAVIERFGELPDFEALANGLDELNAEFCGWVDGVGDD